jgi:beta-fructofuranosidase
MALRLEDKWIWDSWYAFDGQRYHAFYLHASRALGDPVRRHRNPIIGHAVSDDLTNWTVVRDALIVSDSPAFDSWTTWTGSVIQDDDGLWWMFYTGTSREDGGDVQTVGAATSTDLMEWTKLSSEPMVSADARWYEKLDKSIWHDEAWRDPWVFRFDNDPSTWHMLVTARANHGDPATRGVLGHATSADLKHWDVQPPLSTPGQGFGQLEVFQFEVVDGVPVLVFCCGWRELSAERRAEFGEQDATYSLAVNADLTAIDLNRAKAFVDPMVYAARIIKGKDGWYLIGFVNEVDGEFVGELCDPVPVTATLEDGLVRR